LHTFFKTLLTTGLELFKNPLFVGHSAAIQKAFSMLSMASYLLFSQRLFKNLSLPCWASYSGY